MATGFAGGYSCAQPTSLQTWFIQSQVCTLAKRRYSASLKVSATASSATLSVGRRQLLAGFAAMTAGANQVCKLIHRSLQPVSIVGNCIPVMFMDVCSPDPTCRPAWKQKHSPASYQQIQTMLHLVYFGWQGFRGLSIHVINFFHNAWGHNVY